MRRENELLRNVHRMHVTYEYVQALKSPLMRLYHVFIVEREIVNRRPISNTLILVLVATGEELRVIDRRQSVSAMVGGNGADASRITSE